MYPEIKKGMTVYHRSGTKGVIEKVLYSRTAFTKEAPKIEEIHVIFDSSIRGMKHITYKSKKIGSLLFLSFEEYMQAKYPINNTLNRISLSQIESLLRNLRVDLNVLTDWSNTFKFIEIEDLHYGFHDESTIYLNFYHPSRYGTNPLFGDYDNKILLLKKNEPKAMNYFYKILDKIIAKDAILCTVPPSSPNSDSGIIKLAKLLAKNNRTDATGCLIRHTKIEKLATGGSREVSVQLNSIRVEKTHLIQGKEILLLDDVLTSGNSMKACKEFLYESEAKKVRCLVLGKTYRFF